MSAQYLLLDCLPSTHVTGDSKFKKKKKIITQNSSQSNILKKVYDTRYRKDAWKITVYIFEIY